MQYFNPSHQIAHVLDWVNWHNERIHAAIRGRWAQDAQENANQDQRHYYQVDHLGTPLELFDTDGNTVWSAKYRAWGGVLAFEVELVKQPLRFQGQYADEETGLYYNRHRYYDPETARFVTQDPIGLLGGENAYQYAANTTAWVDPLGLKSNKLKPNMNRNPNKQVSCGTAAHHLIPEHLENTHPALIEANKRGIYSVNQDSNGVVLPTSQNGSLASGKPLHSGGHLGAYYAAAASRLDAIGDPTKLSNRELGKRLHSVERAMKKDLETGKLRLQNTDKRPPGTICKL